MHLQESESARNGTGYFNPAYNKMHPEKIRPVLAISSQNLGIFPQAEVIFVSVPHERDCFRTLPDRLSDNVIGDHAVLDAGLHAILEQLSYDDSSIIGRVRRLGFGMMMRSVEETIAEAGQAGRNVYVLFHSDAAAAVYQKVKAGKLQIPLNVRIAIENDEGIHHGFWLKKLFPGEDLDPCRPELVKRIYDLFREENIPVMTVLDIEHLQTSCPDISPLKAKEIYGGVVDILHLSGENHQGLTVDKIVEHTEMISPTYAVVLEGPRTKHIVFAKPGELLSMKILLDSLLGRNVNMHFPFLLEKPLHRLRAKEAMRHIPIATNATVLDLGSGDDGLLKDELTEAGFTGKYFGVDWRDGLKQNQNLVNADLERSLPFGNNSADIVVGLSTLQHISGMAHLLSEARRVLKSDGRLIMTIPSPNAESLLGRLAHLGLVSPEQINAHKKYLSSGELSELLHQAGFHHVTTKEFEFGMNKLVIAE